MIQAAYTTEMSEDWWGFTCMHTTGFQTIIHMYHLGKLLCIEVWWHGPLIHEANDVMCCLFELLLHLHHQGEPPICPCAGAWVILEPSDALLEVLAEGPKHRPGGWVGESGQSAMQSHIVPITTC
jgi:hypothetical protein